MATLGSLYALDQGFKGGLFKLYIAEGALCGAKLGGTVYDEDSARVVYAQFGLLGWFIAKQAGKKAAAKRAALEAEMDASEAGGPVFMGRDKANFSLSANSLQNVTLSGKVGWLQKGSKAIAVLQLQTADGQKRKFLLQPSPDAPNAFAMQTLLARIVPGITLQN